jgi:hypothetical protein
MPIQIDNAKDIHPFYVRRYIAEGGNCAVAPRVTELRISALRRENLRYVEWTPRAVTGSRCLLHKGCMGHLQGVSSSVIGVSPLVANESADVMDERAKLNTRFFEGNDDSDTYGRGIRSSLMGKRGLIRHSTMGFKPITSGRGVATCHWSEDPRRIYIPRTWMDRMRIPTRNSQGPLISPYFTFRNAVDGDLAVLLRCPVMTADSVQPVRVYGWDQASIGVHPEMCDLLSLDYDGDEVHVAIVSGTESQNELLELETRKPSGKFDSSHIRSLYSHLKVGIKSSSQEFMAPSTMSVSQIGEMDYDSPIYALCRCKASSVEALRKSLTGDSVVENFVSSSITALNSMIESHLTVSKGYIFARQLKISSMQTRKFEGGFQTMWERRPSPETWGGYTAPHLDRVYGFPGSRLASRIAGKIMQETLDAAKKQRVSKSPGGSILSMFGEGSNASYLVADSDGRVSMRGTQPRESEGLTLLATSSRSYISSVRSPNIRRKLCYTSLACMCEELGIPYSNDELSDLATAFYGSCLVDHGSAMASFRGVPFLSKTNCDFFTVAVTESLLPCDAEVEPEQREFRNSCGIDSPIVAVCTGNMVRMQDRSILACRGVGV